MLVLTRKIGQKIIINDNIEVIILETRGDAAKIGIKAPKNVTIYREEIYEEIKKTNEMSGENIMVSDLDGVFNLFGSKQPVLDPYSVKPNAIIKGTVPKKPDR